MNPTETVKQVNRDNYYPSLDGVKDKELCGLLGKYTFNIVNEKDLSKDANVWKGGSYWLRRTSKPTIPLPRLVLWSKSISIWRNIYTSRVLIRYGNTPYVLW